MRHQIATPPLLIERWAHPAHQTLPSPPFLCFILSLFSIFIFLCPFFCCYKIRVQFCLIHCPNPCIKKAANLIKSNSGSTRRLYLSQNVFLFGGELSADTENLVLIYQRAATKFVKIFPLLASISQEGSQQIDSRYKLYMWGNTPKSRSTQILITRQRCSPTSPLYPAKHWAFLFSPWRVSPFKFFIRRRYVKARCWGRRRASKVFGNAQP